MVKSPRGCAVYVWRIQPLTRIAGLLLAAISVLLMADVVAAHLLMSAPIADDHAHHPVAIQSRTMRSARKPT
jgi:UDP-N-acetylmuramate-alanine ligase